MELLDGENLNAYLQRTAMPPLAPDDSDAPAWRLPGRRDREAPRPVQVAAEPFQQPPGFVERGVQV